MTGAAVLVVDDEGEPPTHRSSLHDYVALKESIMRPTRRRSPPAVVAMSGGRDRSSLA